MVAEYSHQQEAAFFMSGSASADRGQSAWRVVFEQHFPLPIKRNKVNAVALLPSVNKTTHGSLRVDTPQQKTPCVSSSRYRDARGILTRYHSNS